MSKSKLRMRIPVTSLFFLLLTIHAEPDQDWSASSLRFFKDLAETRGYSLGRPASVQPTPDGLAVLFLRGGPRDPVLRLYELKIKGGEVAEVLTPEAVLKGAEEKLSPDERARRERQRQTLRGFTSFQLSQDGSQILLPLSGKLYVVRRSNRSIAELGAEGWIDPQFSPDGKYVAAVRNGEVYVIDIASRQERQLTSGGSETLTHGLAEFVAQEEMGRFSGYWWSPDSRSIVYQETDQSAVERRYVANPLQPQQEPERYFYPRAGTANVKIRLGVLSIAGGSTTWIKWDTEKYPYLARVAWHQGSPLTLLVQTREQQEEKLLTVNLSTGETRDLLIETDEAWLNLDESGRTPYWFQDGTSFLWASERRGGWQLEIRRRDGTLLRELTSIGFGFRELVHLDEKRRIAIVAGGADPRETHMFRVSLEGGEPVKMTEERGLHSGTFSKDGNIYVHTFNLMNGRADSEVRSWDDKFLAGIPSVAEPVARLPEIELLEVGRDRTFDAVVIRPRDFQKGRKYPVILEAYAGPTVRVVLASPRVYLESQWRADHGYIVVLLDGRGTPWRSREWERVIRGNLIDIALEDQIAGLQALGEKVPEMDLSRVGVVGWSFGGYLSAMATIRRPDIFRCGVAGAPVTDWEDYDTHYTERYLGMPSANAEAYRKSCVLSYASQLERPLLLVHGLTDDNVYFQHTLKLANALLQAGRPYELVPLLSTHMVPDPLMRLRLETRIMDFFNQHLGLPLRYTKGEMAEHYHPK